ncbi:hypothetical protein RE6C_01161 [Rhodopirellula europaea 6C]|uniref:Uncharacterized protein n=1 Tax=Rhodopirellula europaea 6C TaxID=1263867 RepID=M2B799_9BACT|nr:hypothetical protein RE6C_01161 [Rhodopirellula europaea 6C]
MEDHRATDALVTHLKIAFVSAVRVARLLVGDEDIGSNVRENGVFSHPL